MARRKTNGPRHSSTRRAEPSRSGDLVLIVCEGAKTEPGYFKGLRKVWRLLPASIVVCGDECGSAPISVVDYAIERQERGHPEGQLRFDQVWCVIDGDSHESLANAKAKARAHSIQIACSVPCFEIWLLLHFEYTSRPFPACGEVHKALKVHLSNYNKSAVPIEDLMPRIDDAVRHAGLLRRDRSIRPNPATDVDLLVSALKALRPTS